MGCDERTNHKIRVLTTIDQFWPLTGGAEKIALEIVRGTNDSSFKNNVLTIAGKRIMDLMGGSYVPYDNPEGNFVIRRFKYIQWAGIEKNGRYARYLNLIRYIRIILKLRDTFDIIHAHTYYLPATAGIIAGKLLHRKVIVTGHGSVTRLAQEVDSGLYPGFMLRILKHADYYVAISKGIVRECRSILSVSQGRLRYIPNGIDHKRFLPRSTELTGHAKSRFIDAPDGRPIIVYHGRLQPGKNIGLLLHAISGLKREGVDTHCVIIGSGSMKGPLMRLSNSLGVQDRVQFIPFRTDIEQYLRESDIFCLPSQSEGLPLSLLEAMASGLVCLASDIDGNRDVIQDGVNGYIFDPSSVLKLSQLIVKVRHRESTGPMREIARKTVENSFSLEAMVHSYRNLYIEAAT